MKNTEFAYQDHIIGHHVEAEEVISVLKVVSKGYATSENQLHHVNSSISLVIQPGKGLLTEVLVLIEIELYEKDDYKSTDDIGNRNGQVFIATRSYSFD